MSKTPDEIITSNLAKFVDVSKETGECSELLQKVADENDCAVMAFIAPYAAVRVSPVEMHGASIGLSEEFAIVTAIETIKHQGVNRLYLLVNSPGGGVASSYKIARMIRASFAEIKAFVPHVAASGGTLMILAANDVVMGPMSNLTPIDVQVGYNGQYVSSYSISRALSRLSEFFAKITAEEAPYPWRAMAEKLDPILMEDWTSNLLEMQRYVIELMQMSGYKPPEIARVVNSLIFPDEPHSLVIRRDRVAKMGIRTSSSHQDTMTLKVMKAWLTGYMLTESQKHLIRYVVPTTPTKAALGGKNARAKTGTKKGGTRKKT
jgi:ATP-dependent protease ClpP protease subunit